MFAKRSIVAVAKTTMMLCGFANAATYMVGGDDGWDFNIGKWPYGAIFEAGDILEFTYVPTYHNLWIVNEQNYISCTPSGTRLTSGDDYVILAKGKSYFICGLPQHCAIGQKVEVEAK